MAIAEEPVSGGESQLFAEEIAKQQALPPPVRDAGIAPFGRPPNPDALVPRAPKPVPVQETSQYLSTEIFSIYGITTRTDQVSRVIQAQFGNNPEIGIQVERLIQQYPTASPDIIAGLAVSGQIDLEDALLDDIIKRDARSQDTDMWLWNAMKNTSRNLFVVAEDLYNLTPGYVAARTATNWQQGSSFTEALDQSLSSTGRYEAAMSKFDMPTYQGDGFIPSLDMNPQSAEFWAGVQQMLKDDIFEGSPHEKLIQASNEQKFIDMKTQGFNTYAFATQQWESTLLHKTLDDGTVVARPLSYGSLAAMPFTSPGSVAYTATSSFFDIGARIVFEPTDIAFDAAFRQLGRAKALIPDNALFSGDNFRAVRAAFNETFNINLHLGAVPEEAVGRMSREARNEIAGVTGREIDEFGNATIDISAQAVRNQYDHLQQLKRSAVWDAADPYAQGYKDAGFDSPAALLDEVNAKGGLPGQLMLVVEHELVHDVVESDWYKVIEIDGKRYVDYNQFSDIAPDELREIAKDAPKRIQGEAMQAVVVETRKELQDAADELRALRKDMSTNPSLTAEDVLEGNTRLSYLETQVRELTEDLQYADGRLKEIRAGQADNLKLQAEYVERHATKIAAENMRNNTWSAPEVYKAAKKKAGIIQSWRPWVNPKLFSEYLMSSKGQAILDKLAAVTTYDKVTNVLRGQLTPAARMRIAESTNRGEIAKIIGNGMGGTPMQRPKIGRFYDLSSSALDAWGSSTVFKGGQYGDAVRRLARRAGAQGGYNVLTILNPEENMEVISSLLKTAGVDEKTISRIQKLAIRNQDKGVTGLAIVNDAMMDAVIKRTTTKYGTRAGKEVKYIQDQWRLAERQNRIYRTDAQGNIRGFYHNGKMYLPDPDDPLRVDLSGGQQAIMESQFVSTSIVTPSARKIRRLTSQQRRAYEAIRRTMPEWVWQRSGGYLPLGLESSTFMKASDWTFGIWRDFALMRFGWSFRILPEEHLRAAASGYSTMLTNPFDYFLALNNKMDITLPGETQTIAEAVGADGLGTAVLRALEGDETFDAAKATWVNASFESDPDLFWAGTTRAYVSIANDEITSYIAREGIENTLVWLRSDEGKVVIDRVVKGAATDGGLDMLNDPRILRDYVDSQNLYIAEHTGGGGIYKDRAREGRWFNSDGVEVTSFRRIGPDGRPTVFNDRQSLFDFIEKNGGEKPLAKTTRPQLEQIAADVAGYDIDELENIQKVAHVSQDGDQVLKEIMGYKGKSFPAYDEVAAGERTKNLLESASGDQLVDELAANAAGPSVAEQKILGDINIDKDMPFDTVREIDNQLKSLFELRGITPHHTVPVPADELIREGLKKNPYRTSTDAFFKWMNAVPSTKYNRGPIFNQAMGYNTAIQYAYANPAIRRGLDAYMGKNPALREMFDLGKKKVLRDMDWKDFPEAAVIDEVLDQMDEAMRHIDDGTIPDHIITDENHVPGWEDDPERYSLAPMVADSSGAELEATQAFWDKLAEIGLLRGSRARRLGTYAQYGAMEVQFGDNILMQGGAGFFNPMDAVWDIPTQLETDLGTFMANRLGYQDPVKFKAYAGARSQDLTNEIIVAKREIAEIKRGFADDISSGKTSTWLDRSDEATRELADKEAALKIVQDEFNELKPVIFMDDVDLAKAEQDWARKYMEDYPTAEELKAQMAERAQEIYDSQKGKDFEDFGLGNNLAGGFTFSMDRVFVYIFDVGQNPVSGTAIKAAVGTEGYVPTMGVYFREDFSPSQIRQLVEHGDLETSRTLALYGLEEIDGVDAVWQKVATEKFPYTFPEKDVPIYRGARTDLLDFIENYRTPGVMGKRAPKGSSEFDQFMYAVEKMRESNTAITFGIGSDRFVSKFNIDFDASLDVIRSQAAIMFDNVALSEMWGDKFNQRGFDYIMSEMGKGGVNLSPQQKSKFRELWDSHDWEQTEITISNYGVKPVALFPEPLAREMLNQQVVFTSNKAVGDAAQFMDTYLEDVTDAGGMVSRQFEDVLPKETPEMVMDKILKMSKRDELVDLDTATSDDFTNWLDDMSTRKEEMWRFESSLEERTAFNKRLAYDRDYDPLQTGDIDINYAAWIDSDAMRTWFRKVQESIDQRINQGYIPDVTVIDDEILEADFILSQVASLDFSLQESLNLIDDFDTYLGFNLLNEGLHLDENLPATWKTVKSHVDRFVDEGDKAYDRLINVKTSSITPDSPFFGKKLKQPLYEQAQRDEIVRLVDTANGNSAGYAPGELAPPDELRTNLATSEIHFNEWNEANGRSRYRIDFSEEAVPEFDDLAERAEALLAEINDAVTPKFNVTMDEVPFAKRQETIQRQLGYENYRYNWMETGSPQNTIPDGGGFTPQRLKDAEQIEVMLKGAKEAAMDEVKDLLYDLSNKSNIADAYRLLFPFGDAWYEVLSRWAKIMNPAQSGSQPFRNVRRLQVPMQNARKEGFLSTNEYGEEVMNWPGLASMVPGPLDGTPAGLSSQMPLSSLLFIDPSARGVAGPSMSPWVQLSARIAQPALDEFPVLRDIANTLVYGGADEYMPGKIQNVGDVAESFMPTTIRRMWASVFGDDNRSVYGNTKLRLLETLFASGDPRYNPADPAGVRAAWAVAEKAGTWLSVLRIVDSWFQPGQPQYQPELRRELDPNAPPGDPTLSIVRLANEYRHANDLWGRAEADLYMIERFDVNPVILQGMTAGFVEQPSTWEAVNYFTENKWLLDLSPITAAAVIPRDTETFSQRAWQNQSIDRVMIDGIEGPTFRGDKSAFEIAKSIQRSYGYEQLRALDARYSNKLDALRRMYGPNYASQAGYRIQKRKLDITKRDNRADIMAQYPVVESLNAGDIIGETQGTTGPMLLQELIDVGTPGTKANFAYRQNIPEVAKVAETLTRWFAKLEDISKSQEKGTASPIWWLRSETDKAVGLRASLASDIDGYLQTITNEQAHDYAVWMAKRIIDPLLKDWEWINNEFAPQIDSFPTILQEGTP